MRYPNVGKIILFSEKNFRQNRGDESVACYCYQICAKNVKIQYIAILMLALENHDSLLNKLIISGRPKDVIYYYRHIKANKTKTARN